MYISKSNNSAEGGSEFVDIDLNQKVGVRMITIEKWKNKRDFKKLVKRSEISQVQTLNASRFEKMWLNMNSQSSKEIFSCNRWFTLKPIAEMEFSTEQKNL